MIVQKPLATYISICLEFTDLLQLVAIFIYLHKHDRSPSTALYECDIHIMYKTA